MKRISLIFFSWALLFVSVEVFAAILGNSEISESTAFRVREERSAPPRYRPGPGNPGHRPYYPPIYYPAGHWNNYWQPTWYYPGIPLPLFSWNYNYPVGYWQCAAFNGNYMTYYGVGSTVEQAAYAALYACGGMYYLSVGCYIPPNYCGIR
jgi:hypothetical protein